jgi:hypothetical protein
MKPTRKLWALVIAGLVLAACGTTAPVLFTEGTPYQALFSARGSAMIVLPENFSAYRIRVQKGSWLERDTYDIAYGDAIRSQLEARFRRIFDKGVTTVPASIGEEVRAKLEERRSTMIVDPATGALVPKPTPTPTPVPPGALYATPSPTPAPSPTPRPGEENVIVYGKGGVTGIDTGQARRDRVAELMKDPPRLVMFIEEPSAEYLGEAIQIRFRARVVETETDELLVDEVYRVTGRRMKPTSGPRTTIEEFRESTLEAARAASSQLAADLRTALEKRR